MAFSREIKSGNSIYLAEVASIRENGKVKQKVLEYIGKKEDESEKIDINDVQVSNVKRFADIKILIQLARQLKLTACFVNTINPYWLLLLPICCARKAF